MTNNLPRDFKGIWIPKELWIDQRLSYLEKALMAEIDSLDCGEEHCFAANDYFEKMFNAKTRTISQAITKLKRLGFIQQVGFDGRTRKLKSNLKTVYVIFYGSDSQKSASPTSINPLPSSIEDLPDKEIPNEIPINISPIVPKGDSSFSSSRKKIKEEKVERCERIFTTHSQHENLLVKAKQNVELVKKWYERLSGWKISKEICGGNDYSNIVNWVIDAVERDSNNPEQKSLKASQDWIAKIKEIFKNDSDVYISLEGITFAHGNSQTYIRFSDFGAKEQILNRMRKMNIYNDNL